MGFDLGKASIRALLVDGEFQPSLKNQVRGGGFLLYKSYCSSKLTIYFELLLMVDAEACFQQRRIVAVIPLLWFCSTG